MTTMGKKYSPDVIPEMGAQLVPGRYLLAIEDFDDSAPTSTGKYAIKATMRVVEPAGFAGTPHFEHFVIGTDSDPEADDPESWKGFAAVRYRGLLDKAGVAMTGDVEQDTAAATGQQVGAVVQSEVQGPTNRDGSPNAYAGRVSARVQTWFRPGERELGADTDGAQPVVRGGAAGAAQRAAQATRQAPVSQPRANPPAPARPAPRPAPAPQAAPQKVAAPQAVKCSICGAQVPRPEFVAHVQAHEAEEG